MNAIDLIDSEPKDAELFFKWLADNHLHEVKFMQNDKFPKYDGTVKQE